MAISRASLVAGPAKITFNGVSVFSKDDFEVSIEKETMVLNTSAHGKVGERAIEARAECTFTPEGRFTDAMIAALWTPFATYTPGQSLFGAGTDKTLVMNASDGALHTIVAAGITKLPDLVLSATKTLIGPITFTGIRKNNSGWTTADSLYTVAASGATFVDSTFDPLNIVCQPYLGTWAATSAGAGFTEFDTEDGWTVSFDLQTEEIRVDSVGLVDVRFKSLGVMAKCVPVGPTSTEILEAMEMQNNAAGRDRGYDLSTGDYSGTLTIVGDDGTTYVSLPAAALKTAGYRFGSSQLRQGEIGFVAGRTFASGVAAALFTLDAPA